MKAFLLKRYPLARVPLPRQVAATLVNYRQGERVAWHQHRHGQLVFAAKGVVRVLTPARTWTLPPSRAVWLPSDVDHELHAVGDTALCSVYVEPEVFPWPWEEPAVIAVSVLLRELALTVVDGADTYTATSRAGLAASLLMKVLAETPSLAEPGVPLPRDERLLKLCEHMMNDPASDLTLDFWGEQFGASGRTLARRLHAETGLTFVAWRQQMRVAEAITRLALGQSVAQVAKDLGYRSASAFIVMFRRITGESPQRYLAAS
ncbi:AraC family transcriptional regulator [Burkholderia cepacia]|uniref:AraC family transcriptional regulator n=1 Tax=Burkholderia TaxID=32008 RepID=UPI000F5B5145|nr:MULTISPECIES: helix-turn-helix transcriptional regulator [Burkholderia]MCA7898888.1 helix-turn-helix transcriptional regulator [Burkholderia cepacia]MCA8282586.1 helix-turn-helix transcriptional regulator [Burkholderia cepacia]MDN7611344.1 helix-turn-helix transcriptional regulator [Burkholderia cepacia]RQT60125.1 AraC family transcriptional regulator [Burkholderia cepacia]RQU04011.1 AraC family transcriptional regulator [Burkholderia cepacia]